MNKKVWICILAAVLMIACVATFLLWNNSPITEAEAIQIAQKHVKAKYDGRFEGYFCDAELSHDVWSVAYWRPSVDDVYILGGGAPEVQINANNGRIISCLLQK